MAIVLVAWLGLAFTILAWHLIWTVRGIRRARGSARLRAAGDAVAWVLAAARNEEATLDAFFDALEAQDWPREQLRLILVNDASTDRTEAVARRRLASFAGSRLVLGPGEGHIKALAEGLKAVEGPVVLYTDADCRPAPGWIRGHLEAHAAGATVVCGHIAVEATGLAGQLQRFESAVASLQVAAGCGRQAPPFCRSANWSVRRSLLADVGDYRALADRPSGADIYLMGRLAGHPGARFAFLGAPDTRVTTRPLRGWAATLQQKRRVYGKFPGLDRRQRWRHALVGVAFAGLLVIPGLAVAMGAPGLLGAWLAVVGVTGVAGLLLLRLAFALLHETGRAPWLLPVGLVVWPVGALLFGLLGTLRGYRWDPRLP